MTGITEGGRTSDQDRRHPTIHALDADRRAICGSGVFDDTKQAAPASPGEQQITCKRCQRMVGFG